ncbi:MAG: NAD-dependent epimerase/dehydratase family protein [Solirubrobacterales bacterium]
MRVVVTGATGNVGTSLVAALRREPAVGEIVGLSRRPPDMALEKVRWVKGDVTTAELGPLFEGADAVVHLAWAIEPSRAEEEAERINVSGSRRIFAAVAAARVPALVYASSVGAYGPGPKDRRVDESWPTDGIPSSPYSRQKVRVERILDDFELESPRVRVVRMRPGLIFKAEAASDVRRHLAGPLLPGFLVRPSLIPFVPRVPRLRFQAVHAADVADAYRRALVRDVAGAFNLAAEPVIGPRELGELLKARPVGISPRLLRAAADLSWRLRLQPADSGWVDLALGVPLMDSSRAAEQLGWRPATSSLDALRDLLEGIRHAQAGSTPPLDRKAGGRARAREVTTGVGERQ